MKRIFLLCLVLAGCSTLPKPAPMPDKSRCAVTIKGECHDMSSSEQAGAGSRGHSEEPKSDKLMFYVPPEQLWPEDFPVRPQVCASPFQGRLYSR